MPAPDLTPLEAIGRLAVATVAGGVVGLNRELRRKPAGLRTHALVALGAAIVMVSSVQLAALGGTFSADAVTRTVQGVIVGIGFLGGGVIVRTGTKSGVRNLTTAASIWVVASLGVAAGAGQWAIVLGAVALALVVLLLGRAAERMFARMMSDRRPRRPPTQPPV